MPHRREALCSEENSLIAPAVPIVARILVACVGGGGGVLRKGELGGSLVAGWITRRYTAAATATAAASPAKMEPPAAELSAGRDDLAIGGLTLPMLRELVNKSRTPAREREREREFAMLIQGKNSKTIAHSRIDVGATQGLCCTLPCKVLRSAVPDAALPCKVVARALSVRASVGLATTSREEGARQRPPAGGSVSVSRSPLRCEIRATISVEGRWKGGIQ